MVVDPLGQIGVAEVVPRHVEEGAVAGQLLEQRVCVCFPRARHAYDLLVNMHRRAVRSHQRLE